MVGKKEKKLQIGVLALQGAVQEHITFLQQLGADTLAVKKPEQLDTLDGLVIPGGESTTIGKLLRAYGFLEPLRQKASKGFPLFGTCAGLIILAKPHLGVLDVIVKRNAFGRQKDSFETLLPCKGINGEDFAAVFIRAPYIEAVGQDVEVLSEINENIVAVRQGNLLGISFHPELTEDNRFHQYFLEMVEESRVT